MLRYPRVGDEVATTKPTTTSLWGTAVRPGARAVVLSVGYIRTTVKLDTGSGFVTTTVPTTSLRVIRRNVCEDRFIERGQVVHAARLGVALVMIAPFVIFAIRYVVVTGGTDGLIETIALGLIQSVLDVIQMAISTPVGTGVYLVVGWALWRFAFPK